MNKKKRYLKLSRLVADKLLNFYVEHDYPYNMICIELEISRRTFFSMLRGDYNFTARDIARISVLIEEEFFFVVGNK